MKLHRRVLFSRWGRRLFQLGLLAASVVLLVALIYAIRAQAYDLGELGRMSQRAEVRDRDGELIGQLAGENRIVVPFSRIDPKLVAAILAREDSRFETHPGVDCFGFLRSMIRNVREGRMIQGGSTLTMQLARNTWALGDDDIRGELDRKLLEIVLALRIEDSVPKEVIFENYANRIYLGNGNYGVETAAQDYFGKSASSLSWPEAAAIAGLIRGPSVLNPRANPKANTAQRKQVFDRLLGEGWLNPEIAATQRMRPITLAPLGSTREARSDWLLEQVRRELSALLDPEDLAAVAEVRTTFDLDLQRRAEAALGQHLRQIEAGKEFQSLHSGHDGLEGAVAIVGTKRGDIRVLVGGRNFRRSSYQRAVQMRRQMGSTIKPFVYAAAFEAGLDPNRAVSDAPLGEDPGYQGEWDPENSDGRNLGTVTARDGLVLSRNTVTVRVGREAGAERIAKLVNSLGFDAQPDSETAWLGAGQGSPLQLASAYTVFASAGEYRPPWSLLEVRDRSGRVLFAAGNDQTQILAPEVAQVIDECLHEVTERGTGRSLQDMDFPLRAAGKTGTTNDFLDAWFVGYSGGLSGCVWVGMDAGETIQPGGYGSRLALPLWAEVMKD